MDFSDFHFDRPWVLPLAALLGLSLLAALRWTERRRRRGLARFAAERLLAKLLAGYSPVRRKIKDCVLAAALAVLVAAFAGPRWGREATATRGASEDVVFVLDVSKSMLVADMRPHRLARAKAAVANFVKRKGTGSVGLIAFAGQAFLQCPLTRDHDAFFRSLEEADPSGIQVPGTDLGRALEEAEAAFAPNRNRKLVILLTDGEDLEAGGIEMARQLARRGVVVHTVGVGTPAGGPVTVISPLGAPEPLRDAAGAEVRSRLDEGTLRRIAETNGGRFVRLGPTGEGMETLRLAIQAGTDTDGTRQRGIPRESWFIAFALVLLILESMIPTRRVVLP